MRTSVLVMAGVVTLASRGAAAYVSDPTMEDLVGESDVVVVAKVDVIDTYESSPKVIRRAATARVLETLYGDPGPQVRFRASRVFACDVSSAVVGETAVLFLGKPRPNGVRPIAWWGRGRFPVEQVDGAAHVVRPLHESFVPLATFRESVRPMLIAKGPAAAHGIDDGALDEELDSYFAPSIRDAEKRDRNRHLGIGFAAGCLVASGWVAVRRRRAARRQPG